MTKNIDLKCTTFFKLTNHTRRLQVSQHIIMSQTIISISVETYSTVYNVGTLSQSAEDELIK